MFKIYQKHLYLCCKTEKLKITVLVFSKRESLTFQNLLKNRKLLLAETFGNILAFDKESKRKLLLLIPAVSFTKKIIYIYNFRVEFFLCLNGKPFDFKKNFMQIFWIFSSNKCILVRLWVKVLVSQVWVQIEITITL